MKKISILAGVAALAFSGVATAQPQGQRGGGAELTRAEAVARAEQRFARIDADRNGQVTRDEMRAGRQQMRAQRAERRQARIARMSPEQRERIADRRAERGGLTQEQRAERRAQRRAQVQAMTAEQRAERRAQRQARRGQRGGLFAGGGTVSLEQFRARALQRFERMDLDRNGTVTRDERRQARQQLRQERQQRRAG